MTDSARLTAPSGAPSGFRALSAAALLAVLALHPPILEAQVVQGQVFDAATSQGVSQVSVLLLRGEQGDTVATRGFTDAQGHFALEVEKSGAYRLRCMVIGYQPVTTPMFDLRAGDQPLPVVVRISQVAVLLAPLEIVARRPPLLADRWLITEGYYDRAHHYGPEGLGAGRFLDRDAIDRTGAFNVTDIVRLMPGVKVVGAGGPREVITFRVGRCVPPVFVDGTRLTDGAGVNDLVSASDVVALEVYAGIITPPEYAFGGESCGAIVLWTGRTGGHPQVWTDPPARELTLDLTLSADTATRKDAMVATLVLANGSDTVRTVCIIGSHFTLLGPGGRGDVAAKVPRHPCASPVELAPQASRSWREEVILAPGTLLLQKRLDLRMTPCNEGPRCKRSLTSNWKLLAR